jgi:translocation protein SEC72
MLPQQPDPVALAAIEANFKPVDFLLDPSNDARVLCKPHKLDKCSDCGHDFTFVNALAGIFTANPSLMCPPPPQVVQPQRSQAVMKAKEEGNVRCIPILCGVPC